MARIMGVDIPGHKRIDIALRYMYGIGPAIAGEIIEATGINPTTRAKDLTEDQLTKNRSRDPGRAIHHRR